MRYVGALLLAAMLGRIAGAGPAEDERARRLSDQGLAQFNQAHYPQAIAIFQQSFALRPLPVLLFDVAQAYRLQGDCPHALEHYRRYVEAAPEAPNRMLVDGFIADMERCPRPPPPKPKLYKKWWLWTAVGLVLAAGAVGLGVGIGTAPPPNPTLGTVVWRP